MDSMPVVFDISSDEEGWGEIRGGGGGTDDDYDWISELLDESERVADDSDDLMLVGEVVLNPKKKSKSKSLSVAAKPLVKDLDDDCVVLDGDPDKPVVIENNTTGDSDDLLIVGEKGQIACRDYPHARHLCAKFPFTSSPHERHCHQCHCYVCDSLAPCVHWGTGTSSVDHCHATDKVEFWKLQRQNLKQGDKAPLPVPKLPDTSLSMQPLQTIPVPPPLTLLQPNSLAQNQISRPTTIRACSTSTNFGILNIKNQGRSQHSVYVSSRNKFHPHSVPQQLLGTRNNIVRRDRRHNVGNLGPQSINSHTIFRRAGSPGVALATNRSRYSSSHNNDATPYSRNPSPAAASNDKNPTRWHDYSGGMTSDSNAYQTPSQQNTSSSFGDSVPFQSRVSSHPNMGSGFVNSVPSQPRVSSQPNMGSGFVNSVPSQPQVSSQPSIGSGFVHSVPSPQACSQPNMDSNFQMPFQQQVSSQPDMGISFVNPVPSQPQVYSQPIPAADDSQDGFQHGNETQSALDPIFPDFNASWVAPTGQSYHPPLVENSQVQSAGLTYHPPLLAEFDPQIPVNANPGSLDFQFDSWVLENQSVSGALGVSVPSGLNAYSPEPAPVDAGFFFDY